jgi:hypothetical protein
MKRFVILMIILTITFDAFPRAQLYPSLSEGVENAKNIHVYRVVSGKCLNFCKEQIKEYFLSRTETIYGKQGSLKIYRTNAALKIGTRYIFLANENEKAVLNTIEIQDGRSEKVSDIVIETPFITNDFIPVHERRVAPGAGGVIRYSLLEDFRKAVKKAKL